MCAISLRFQTMSSLDSSHGFGCCFDYISAWSKPRVGGLIAFTKECHNDGGVNCTWVRWANFNFSFMSLRPSMD